MKIKYKLNCFLLSKKKKLLKENAVEAEKSSYENLKYGDDLMYALDNVEKLKAE